MKKNKNLDSRGLSFVEPNFVRSAVLAILLSVTSASLLATEVMEEKSEMPMVKVLDEVDVIRSKVSRELSGTVDRVVDKVIEDPPEDEPKDPNFLKRMNFENRVSIHPQLGNDEATGALQSVQDDVSVVLKLDQSERRLQRAEDKLMGLVESGAYGSAFKFALKSWSILPVLAKHKGVKWASRELLNQSEDLGEFAEGPGLVSDTAEGLDRGDIQIEIMKADYKGTEIKVHLDSDLVEDGIIPFLAEIPIGGSDHAVLISPEAAGVEIYVGGGHTEDWALTIGGKVAYDGEAHAGFRVIKKGGFGGIKNWVTGWFSSGDVSHIADRPARHDPSERVAKWDWASESVQETSAETKKPASVTLTTDSSAEEGFRFDRIGSNFSGFSQALKYASRNEDVANDDADTDTTKEALPSDIPTEEVPENIVGQPQPTG